MSYVFKNKGNIAKEFTEYCKTYGFNKSNCERLTTDKVYEMLYECWVQRLKEKRYSFEAYVFEKDAGNELMLRAEQVAKLEWQPEGYKSFQVYHPTRTINAPFYGDRIVEQWLTEKYLIPFWKDKLLPNNLACQKEKGPHLALEIVKKLLEDCYIKYGLDYWIFQTDMEKYYENLSHEDIMHLHEGINPYGYFLLRNIVDSWEEENCYAKLLDLCRAYGIPKGNLPSQWFGITMLNELDHLLTDFPNCEGEVRYMDDLLCVFPTKKDCILCKEFAENYLKDKRIGVRLHPTKTRYAPAKCGFNFCGWHLRPREDGSVEVKLRRDRKTLKKKELKSKQKAYREGKITWEQVSNSMQSTFAHYKHGDTKNLRKYISNRYRFQRDSNNYNKRNKEKD